MPLTSQGLLLQRGSLHWTMLCVDAPQPLEYDSRDSSVLYPTTGVELPCMRIKLTSLHSNFMHATSMKGRCVRTVLVLANSLTPRREPPHSDPNCWWLQNWTCTQVFEGHSHYVMQVVFNPKDTNTFASASLDRTVKVTPDLDTYHVRHNSAIMLHASAADLLCLLDSEVWTHP